MSKLADRLEEMERHLASGSPVLSLDEAVALVAVAIAAQQLVDDGSTPLNRRLLWDALDALDRLSAAAPTKETG